VSVVIAARLGWAALLMCCPRAVLRAGGDPDPDQRWLVGARVLGVRHVVQACVQRGGRSQRLTAVAVVDGVHAASAFGLGLSSKRHRRLAFMDAGLAVTFALSTVWCEARAAGHDSEQRRARHLSRQGGSVSVRSARSSSRQFARGTARVSQIP
jgi:hypothetical protein